MFGWTPTKPTTWCLRDACACPLNTAREQIEPRPAGGKREMEEWKGRNLKVSGFQRSCYLPFSCWGKTSFSWHKFVFVVGTHVHPTFWQLKTNVLMTYVCQSEWLLVIGGQLHDCRQKWSGHIFSTNCAWQSTRGYRIHRILFTAKQRPLLFSPEPKASK